MEKKHAPIEELREAGKEANRLLREKGIHTRESTIDRILKENKTVLPGIPAYLPHRWTLQESRRYMRDIIRLWVEKNKKNQKRQENTSAFFAFLVTEMTRIEEEAQKKVNETPTLLKSLTEKLWVWRVFTPLRILETTQAITRFMVDSFAVSMVVKEHHTTTEFAEWFMKWTLEMETFWMSKEEKDK